MENSTTQSSSTTDFLSIQEVASLVGKSIQTIRRLVKSKKLKTKKKKTPQGFRYLIEKKSVLKCFEISENDMSKEKVSSLDKRDSNSDSKSEVSEQIGKEKQEVNNEANFEPDTKSQTATESQTIKSEESKNPDENQVSVNPEDFKTFVKTLDNLVAQHSEERQNFLRLVNTLQEQVFVLENKINMLQAPKKKWYKFWA